MQGNSIPYLEFCRFEEMSSVDYVEHELRETCFNSLIDEEHRARLVYTRINSLVTITIYCNISIQYPNRLVWINFDDKIYSDLKGLCYPDSYLEFPIIVHNCDYVSQRLAVVTESCVEIHDLEIGDKLYSFSVSFNLTDF